MRQNPHVRICGGPGSATTLVYPTTLGERDGGTVRLEQAVAVFSEALKERTRARNPLGWAETQNNLGRAIQILRERGRAF